MLINYKHEPLANLKIYLIRYTILSKHSEGRLSCPSTETVVIVPEFKGFAGVGLMIYYGRSKKVNSYLGGNGAHSLVKMALSLLFFMVKVQNIRTMEK